MSPQRVLFDVPAVKKVRNDHRAECAALKAEFGIKTHVQEAEGTRDWMALSMPAAIRRLKDYSLTDDEKTNLYDITSGYCRLLDECGLLIDGQDTEFEAVKLAAEAARNVLEIANGKEGA